MYSLDFDLLVQRLIRWTLRKPFVLAYCKVLIAPLVNMWAEFETVYLQLEQQIGTTIQHDSLLNFLRMLYPTVGGFQVHIAENDIEDNYTTFLGEHHAPQFSYFLNEPNATAKFETFIAEDDIPFEYTVIIPTAYQNDQSAIQAILNRYRPVGRHFDLVFQDL